jgi:hypothetical protein
MDPHLELHTIEWSTPEYSHKERTPDFFWAIGIITIIGILLALWFKNYVFAIFILVGGFCLILFSAREPEHITFTITTDGLLVGREKHEWKKIKGFKIKKSEPYNKLLVETGRYFLPMYTIPLPSTLTTEVHDELIKVIPVIELEEPHSVLFAEKIGF